MATKTIVVTGGAGFLGVHLIRHLLADKSISQRICVIDNLKTSSKKELNKLSQEHPDQIDFFEGDVTKWEAVAILLDFYETIDEIYHMASIASPPLYTKAPLETLDVGYTGTKNLLDLIVKHYPKCKLLFASSSEVYGQPLVHPQTEEYYGNVNPYGNRSAYDESKRVGETLLWIYNKTKGVDTRIVRIFNTYGPGMSLSDGRIITEMIRCYLYRKPLRVLGHGNQTRCFNYVKNTVSDIITVMKSDYTSPVNIGSDNEITINELVNTFQQITGSLLDIQNSLLDKDDPLKRKPDLKVITNLRETQLNNVSLENGLQSTLLYFLNYFFNSNTSIGIPL